MTVRKLQVAMALYALLGIGAWLLLKNEFRLVVWVFLAGMAVKSYLAYKKETLGQ